MRERAKMRFSSDNSIWWINIARDRGEGETPSKHETIWEFHNGKESQRQEEQRECISKKKTQVFHRLSEIICASTGQWLQQSIDRDGTWIF